MKDRSIRVTQPSLPPLEEYVAILKQVWESRTLTNVGPVHQQLEKALCEYLGVGPMALFNNGTSALLTGLRALDLRGEVITTPYSFVATSHALVWNNLTPVFVDIESHTMNIDPSKIEEAVSEKTSAILAVHCYGLPCDVEAIEEVAAKHGLKVIYDAAHAFGVEDHDESVLVRGDLSILSFHATKVFNTAEGGAIVCHDLETKRRIEQLRNFGIVDERHIDSVGLNGKMSELSAALGLAQLKYVNDEIERRRAIDLTYRRGMGDVTGIRCLPRGRASRRNCAYFPVIIEDTYPLSRDALYDKLQEHDIHARRYFYPLISALPMYRTLPSAISENLRIASKVAATVLCLPIFGELSRQEQMRIIETIKESAR